jgi:hypothetical protein
MDFTDLEMTFIVVVVLAAAAMVVVFDHWRKQRKRQKQPEPQRVKSHIHSIASVARPQRPIWIFDASPVEFAPARKLAAERPLEPVVGITTTYRQPVQLRARETVTVEMARPSAANPMAPTVKEVLGLDLPAFTIDAALWERLISSQSKMNLLSAADSGQERADEGFSPSPFRSKNTIEASYQMIQEDVRAMASSTHPRGMLQPPVFEELLRSDQPFTGLVVSIGINDSDSSMWHSQGLMQSVGGYIAGLLRENDFSCRTGYDEFVMVCQGEQGAQSQRRLNHISERLWDFQLRGVGACAILFSWGGVQVQDQPLAEAIASATERMRQTKRTGHSAQAAVAHRQAV